MFDGPDNDTVSPRVRDAVVFALWIPPILILIAIGVAVSEAGKRLNETDKQYVEVEPGVTGCPACGEPFDAAFLAANTALVGLLLEIDVFNADSEEHAERIAKSEVGGALRDVPLEVIDVFETDADEDEEPER